MIFINPAGKVQVKPLLRQRSTAAIGVARRVQGEHSLQIFSIFSYFVL